MTIKDARHNTCPTIKQYVASWTAYIDELTPLALAADVEYEEFAKVNAQLRNWVAAAVNNIHFKENSDDD